MTSWIKNNTVRKRILITNNVQKNTPSNNTNEVIINKNEYLNDISGIPIVTIAYNNYFFIKNFIEQIEKYENTIIIIDNKSTYPRLLKYYEYLKEVYENKIRVIFMDKNYGHTVYRNIKLPDIYILSDPDLELNKNLPNNYIEVLLKISEKYKSHKTGFALKLDYENFITNNNFHTTKYKWEKKYWVNNIPDNTYEMYYADIDTTFCLVNNKYSTSSTNNIRIAGDFTCRHLPWYKDYIKQHITREELEYWTTNNISSSIIQFSDNITGAIKVNSLY